MMSVCIRDRGDLARLCIPDIQSGLRVEGGVGWIEGLPEWRVAVVQSVLVNLAQDFFGLTLGLLGGLDETAERLDLAALDD